MTVYTSILLSQMSKTTSLTHQGNGWYTSEGLSGPGKFTKEVDGGGVYTSGQSLDGGGHLACVTWSLREKWLGCNMFISGCNSLTVMHTVLEMLLSSLPIK